MKKFIELARKSYVFFTLTGITILLINWLTDYQVNTNWQVTAIILIVLGMFVEGSINLIINNKNEEDEQ